MHQPSKVSGQNIQTVIADLEAQSRRLTDAIAWTKNVSKGIEAAGRQITFTNVGPIEPMCREVGIAFSLTAGGISQDVLVFTLVSTPTEEEIASMRLESALAGEAMRLANLLHWQAQGVRVFETWFVPQKSIWQDSPEATQVFLAKTVKEWLAYWFERPPVPVFRPRSLRIQPIKPLGATR
jgi:hypothetical protein